MPTLYRSDEAEPAASGDLASQGQTNRGPVSPLAHASRGRRDLGQPGRLLCSQSELPLQAFPLMGHAGMFDRWVGSGIWALIVAPEPPRDFFQSRSGGHASNLYLDGPSFATAGRGVRAHPSGVAPGSEEES